MAADCAFRWTDLAIIFATLLGPILAVQAQGWIDNRREEHRRRLQVFNSLMRTRATGLAPEHVNALNAVPLEFPKEHKKYKKLTEAWRIYLDHLSSDANATGWAERRIELFGAMMQTMGELLGYQFDAVELKKDVYQPIAHGAAEIDANVIRQGLAALLKGDRPLPLEVKHMPPGDRATLELWFRVLSKLETTLDRMAKEKNSSKSDNVG